MDPSEHPGWRSAPSAAGEPAFRRPLGALELGFYWDAVTDGVAVTVNVLDLEAAPAHEHEVFARDNVVRAWLRLKQRFPLLGAAVEELPGAECIEFVVRETALKTLRPGELNFVEFTDAKDVARFREQLHNGPTVLGSELLARVWVGAQRDAPGRWWVFIPVVHYITDGMGNATVVREFCEELASLGEGAEVGGVPLEARLRTIVPTEVLTPSSKLSVPRRRWRFAIAKVIQDIRGGKTVGGHTLPTLPEVSHTKPLSRAIFVQFTVAESQQIMRTCRAWGLTLGNAHPVLSQLAFARLLHRLHAQGTLSDADWETRLRQPMHYTGPMNYRPYLDSAWYKSGGAEEVCIAISFYTLTLPSLPRAPTSPPDATGAPPFHALLSPARFRARAQAARAQSKALAAHPLLHEFHALRLTLRNARTRTAALALREGRPASGLSPLPGVAPSAGRFAELPPCVFANGGASLGDRDALMPEAYPLPGAGAPPEPVRLRLHGAAHDLRCRMGELYLGALTWRGRLQFFAAFDARTYDEALVRAWTEEVRGATLAFLGAGAEVPGARL
ncbi:hypothetical protein PsYK624_081430 [Phanerochaete sordida]|uniref:Condensation domain-containing protein n=1 Tax=Phanerochaete sordida TaxID=48140 RepID=A0A9P3LE79_9APHY|nr:hypothetical protein PsYK624_081430 [Phanerochaete sordida]